MAIRRPCAQKTTRSYRWSLHKCVIARERKRSFPSYTLAVQPPIGTTSRAMIFVRGRNNDFPNQSAFRPWMNANGPCHSQSFPIGIIPVRETHVADACHLANCDTVLVSMQRLDQLSSTSSPNAVPHKRRTNGIKDNAPTTISPLRIKNESPGCISFERCPVKDRLQFRLLPRRVISQGRQ